MTLSCLQLNGAVKPWSHTSAFPLSLKMNLLQSKGFTNNIPKIKFSLSRREYILENDIGSTAIVNANCENHKDWIYKRWKQHFLQLFMHWDSDCSSGKITKYKYRSFNFYFCQIPWALIFIPLIGLWFEIYCCVCDIISCDSPSPHNKAASERGDDISAGADVNFATDRARPSGGSYHGLSQLSRRVKRLSQPPSSWNCHIFTGVAGPQTCFSS